MIIALDGPAASGKGTLARRLADHFGLRHLDTGLLYRGVGAAMMDRGADLDDEETATQIAGSLDLSALDRESLSRHHVGEAASRVAALPRVRATLLDAQRAFALEPPGAVLDGRDIGTVVCPAADIKFFVTADIAERARRRSDEMRGRGLPVSQADVHADLARRDARDRGRDDAPMTRAEDAHLLDTTHLDIEAAFERAVVLVNSAWAG